MASSQAKPNPVTASRYITLRIPIPGPFRLRGWSEFKSYLVAVLAIGLLPVALMLGVMALAAIAPGSPSGCDGGPPQWVDSLARMAIGSILPASGIVGLLLLRGLFSRSLSFHHFLLLLCAGLPLATSLASFHASLGI